MKVASSYLTQQPARKLAAAVVSYIALIGCTLFGTLLYAGEEKPVQIVASGQNITTPNEASTVTIDKFTYSPAQINVVNNTTVVWINREPFEHDVTFKASGILEEELISPRIGKGGRLQVSFHEPGEYHYYCHLHPFMEGIVRVKAK